jgi:hypothetical protein
MALSKSSFVSLLRPEAPLACSSVSNLVLTFRDDSMTIIGLLLPRNSLKCGAKRVLGKTQNVREFPIVNNNNNKENLIIIIINDR